MFTSTPYEPTSPQQTVPHNVANYLRSNGWHQEVSSSKHGLLWRKLENSSSDVYGLCTWEQALAYTTWSKLHLGAV